MSSRARNVVVCLAALALLVFTTFPFLWMASTAFKVSNEIFATPPTLWPRTVTLANLERLFAETRFLTYFFNSLKVSAATVLFTYMFAPIMIIIPFYIVMRTFGLANTHIALVLAYCAFSLPFALWMLRSFFQSIPVDIEDAAMIDGASRPKVVLYIVLPLAGPGVVATGIFTFILAWNDYIFARVLLSADELKTLPVGIADLYNASVVDWGMIMAAGLLVIVPVLGVFVFIQRYMVAGLASGGVKG